MEGKEQMLSETGQGRGSVRLICVWCVFVVVVVRDCVLVVDGVLCVVCCVVCSDGLFLDVQRIVKVTAMDSRGSRNWFWFGTY